MITSAAIICSFVTPMIYLQNSPNDCCNNNNPFLISGCDLFTTFDEAALEWFNSMHYATLECQRTESKYMA
jgi:hypothetical protein